MLRPLNKPGLFVTGTDTNVGKTIVAAAIADSLHRRGVRVGVFKPVASGCSRREDGQIVSEDATMLGAVIGNRLDQESICPWRYEEPVAPSVAARLTGRPVDWAVVQAALDRVADQSDVVIVEGAGGLYAPLGDCVTVFDLIRGLRLPTLCVSRPGLGTLNHTALTVDALLSRRVECAGVIINRFPADAGMAERTNVDELKRCAGARITCVIPEAYFDGFRIPPEIAQVADGVDWLRLTRRPRANG